MLNRVKVWMVRKKTIIRALPLAVPVTHWARSLLRDTRRIYLQWRHPSGGYLRCNGVQVFCSFAHDAFAWYDGDAANLAFDQQVIRAAIAQSHGSVFIDVGAHFGFFTAYLGDLLRRRSLSSKIIALEPDPDAFSCLQKTMAQYSDLNVTLLPFAVSDSAGLLTMYQTDAPCLHSYRENNGRECCQTRSITLDSLAGEYLSRSEKIAFIKVDIDGAEPCVFAGGTETFAKHRPIVLMEFAPRVLRAAGWEPQAFFNQLCDDFHVYWVSYDSSTIRHIAHSNYTDVVRTVGDRITDFLLSSTPLTLAELPSGGSD